VFVSLAGDLAAKPSLFCRSSMKICSAEVILRGWTNLGRVTEKDDILTSGPRAGIASGLISSEDACGVRVAMTGAQTTGLVCELRSQDMRDDVRRRCNDGRRGLFARYIPAM
jgi:hypothetical protein